MQKIKHALILLGVITAPHGVRGQVKIKSFTEDPASIFDYSPLLGEDGKQAFSLKHEATTKDLLIASIKGVTTREQAESLKNTELFTLKSRLPKAKKDEFYIEDLVGMQVLTDGTLYGTVKAAHNFGAGDILEIAATDSHETELYAFTKKTFPEVDIDARTLTFCPPEVVEVKSPSPLEGEGDERSERERGKRGTKK